MSNGIVSSLSLSLSVFELQELLHLQSMKEKELFLMRAFVQKLPVATQMKAYESNTKGATGRFLYGLPVQWLYQSNTVQW